MTILACLDASTYAASVAAHAAWLAKELKTDITLLHALDAHREQAALTDLSGVIGVDSRDTLLQELSVLEEQKNRLAMRQGQALLDATTRQLEADAPGVTVHQVQRHGTLTDCVQELEKGATAIVLGKRGEAANMAAGHLGASMERVVRAVHKPVLVASRAYRPIAKMLLAYDGGKSAQLAVETLAAQRLGEGARLDVLTVGKQPASGIEDVIRKLTDAGYQATNVLEQGDVEDTIAAYVQQQHIDLLVMGAYSHSRIRTLFLGSTTTELMRLCKVPVLVFR